jgi:hypothetical protein
MGVEAAVGTPFLKRRDRGGWVQTVLIEMSGMTLDTLTNIGDERQQVKHMIACDEGVYMRDIGKEPSTCPHSVE